MTTPDRPTKTAMIDVLRAETERHFAALVERITETLPHEEPPEQRDADTADNWLKAGRTLYAAVAGQAERQLVKGEVTVSAEDVYQACEALHQASQFWLDAITRLNKARRQITDMGRDIAALQNETDRLRPRLPDAPVSNPDAVRALASVIDDADAGCPRRLVGRLRWSRNLAAAVLAHLGQAGVR